MLLNQNIFLKLKMSCNMSKRNSRLLLEDIFEACVKIFQYTAGMEYNDFINDEKTIDAVIRNFEIIGEAANRLPNEFILKHNSVVWRQIIGLRNRLIHAYFGVDYQILWKIINENLNEFKIQIETVLNSSK